jgi:CBS domain-containing protein
MSVRELLKRKPRGIVTIDAGGSTASATRLLVEQAVGGLPVVGPDGALVGFVSERDVVRAVERHRRDVGDLPVTEVMTRPAPTCAASDPIPTVMARMTRDRLRHLVVVDGGRPFGVISVGDLVKHRLEELEVEAGVLRDYVAGRRAMS